MMKNLSIIIVTYQSADVLPLLLDSLQKQDIPLESYEVVVVDNASSDRSAAITDDRFPAVRIHKNNDNKGFASAANQGAKNSVGKYLLFLNPDTVVEKNLLRTACGVFDTDPAVGIVGSRLVFPNGNEQASCWEAPSWKNLLAEAFLPHRLAERMVTQCPNKTMHVPAVSGACLFTRRDVFERVGGWDERFFMYYEDLDYCRRVEAEGYRVMHLHESVTVHTIASSSHKNLDFFFATLYRSRLFFYRKYLPMPSFVGPVIRVGLVLRIASYSLLGVFLARFAGLSHAHRFALRTLPHESPWAKTAVDR